jgi:V8-like Glu-specific endopeptidase
MKYVNGVYFGLVTTAAFWAGSGCGGAPDAGEAPEDVGTVSSAAEYCAPGTAGPAGRQYFQFLPDGGGPLNAVGFMNNGCTATLIDSTHIVAAAHCFVDGSLTSGDWQTQLRFYPQFNPSLVSQDRAHVPRADVTRVVVGHRVGADGGAANDWAIAQVGNWRDLDKITIGAAALASAVPANGTPLANVAYNRSHFPFNDNDAVTWDNEVWDNTLCAGVQPNGGAWVVAAQPPPFYDGVSATDNVGCNIRWSSGYVHGNCAIQSNAGDLLVNDCDGTGGSSGSPLFVYDAPSNTYQIVGVWFGGNDGSSSFAQLSPTCIADDGTHTPPFTNVGPSVNRFRHAPRFASNVAVNRAPGTPSATTLYAVDSDLGEVVYRRRDGSSPTYTSPFDFWETLGSVPVAGAALSKVATCTQSNGEPEVFVVANRSTVYEKLATGTTWGAWTAVPGTTAVGDIDIAQDASGRCMLFAASTGGNVTVNTEQSPGVWSGWGLVGQGAFTKVTALNYNGTLYAAMIDLAGQIWHAENAGTSWTAPQKIPLPGGVTAWADIDMTWDELGRGFMLATPATQSNSLFFEVLYGTPYSGWHFFDTHLYAPDARASGNLLQTINAPQLSTLTASRWMEDPSGTTSPLVFGTDAQGNVYFVEYQRIRSAPGWDLDWKSFYNDTIPYAETAFFDSAEAPSVAGQPSKFEYGVPFSAGVQPWTFTTTTGIAANGSAFTATTGPAPDGSQVFFVQETGSMATPLTIDATDNRWEVRAQVAERATSQHNGDQTVSVRIDGVQVGLLKPATAGSTKFGWVSTGLFSMTAGAHTLSLVGLNTGDSTLFLDDVIVDISR